MVNDIFKELGIEKIGGVSSGKRKKTAQEIIEESGTKMTAKERAEMLKVVEAGMRKESIEQKREAKTAFQKYTSKVSPGVRKLDTKVGTMARKAIHLLAPKGFVREITRPSGKGTGKRGRPKKSYKLRFVPGIGAVRVPTAVYNKMMSDVKKQRRMAVAQREAQRQQQQAAQYEAEQIAMQQDPRFQSQDQFLEAPDMEHEQEVMDIKQQQTQELAREQARQRYIQQMQPQRGVIQRVGDVAKRFGAGINRLGQPRYPREVQGYPQEFAPQQTRREPTLTTFGGRSNLLNQQNIFNRPENVAVGFKRRI